MSTNKFLIFVGLIVALFALSWGIDQAGAQTVVPPGAAGFNPSVNYNLPNFAYSPNIRKFVDKLPGLGAAGCTRSTPFGTGTCNENGLGQYIPIAIPDKTTYSDADYYEINAEEFSVKMHSDLPPTRLRGYMQVNASSPSVQNVKQYLGPMVIARSYDPTKPRNVNGNGRAARVKFRNNLPLQPASPPYFFLPVDTLTLGAGTGPGGTLFTQNRVSIPHLHGGVTPWISDGTPQQWLTPAGENTVHLKGPGLVNVPDMVNGSVISNSFGVTNQAVPCIGGTACFTPSPGDGLATLYWSNEQSSRLMFYHDHAYGLTRYNVYAGMAAPFLLVDQVEDDMILGTNTSRAFTAPRQVLPNLGGVYEYGIPLVIQDKGFVNDNSTPPGPGFTGTPTSPTVTVDPLWATYEPNATGGWLWWPHEYIPNENIYDPSGANPMGRSDYGPWLNPATIPINATLPTPSLVPEAWGDTMVVNGTAFPYLDVPASAVRFQILNAADDRSLNLSLFVADPANPTEVKMVPAVPNAAYPTWPADGRNGGVPDPTTQGPAWYQIANEGGLMPQVAVLPAQPVGIEYSRLVPTLLNVTNRSLFLMPAMRADVVVDFSAFAGKTLILYNDAPAPMPLFDERNDQYTGAPDFRSTGGAPSSSPGFGPNTRTVMQIRVAASPVSPPFNLAALQEAVPHAYAASQPPPIVPQMAYNAAFGTANGDTFVNIADETINLTGGPSTVEKVITILGGSGYTTPPAVSFISADGNGGGAAATAYLNGVTAVTVTTAGSNYTLTPTVNITPDPLDPNLGIILPASAVATISGGTVVAVTVVDPGANFTLNPLVTFTNAVGDTTGAGAAAISGITLGAVAHITVTNPGSGYTKSPLVSLTGGGGFGATADSMLVGSTVIGMKNITEGFEPWYGRINILLGTTPVPLDPLTPAPAVPGIAQYIDPPSDIWYDGQTYVFRLAHLGVDSHSVHFHLGNLQIVNRIDYTNTMLPPRADELGWRETVETDPFTDLILAVKPRSMKLPFPIPDSIRNTDPTTVTGSTANYLQPAPTPGLPNPAGLVNTLTNYRWEYVWHCHLLSHEENDMMRPIVFYPAGSFSPATGLTLTANVTSPHTNGTTITFTATGTGSVDPTGVANRYYEYRFRLDGVPQYNPADPNFGYSGNRTFSLPLYVAPGPHTVAVDVRTNLTLAAADQTTTAPAFTVTNGRDFNSDGQTDILWRNPETGENVVWNMNGTNLTSFVYLTTQPGPWQIVGTGDFNGDGKPDILWRNPTTGENVVWYMNGENLTSFDYLTALPGPWQIVGTGDFNSSGKPDILWRNPTTGENVVWYMDGKNVTDFAYFPIVSPPWEIVGTGDFDGDGMPDILWRHPTSGENYVWFMNGVGFISNAALTPLPANWQIAGVADFNGDGKPDILWRDPASGQNVVWLMNGTNVTSFVYLNTQPGPWQAVER